MVSLLELVLFLGVGWGKQEHEAAREESFEDQGQQTRISTLEPLQDAR